jgi:dTDP-4-amino-4,6-dideoxygalactose transaminase
MKMIIPAIPRNQVRHFPGQLFALGKMFLSPPSSGTVGIFECEISALTGAGQAIAFSSARSACKALFQAFDYPRGSVILMPSLNYPAIPKTIHAMGFKILWVPLRPNNLHPDTDSLDKEILKEAVAFIWPHHFGFPGPMDELSRFCNDNGLDLIEDCAHALGTRYMGKHIGTFGRAAFVSFETSKMINTFGGGVVLTSDGETAEKLRTMRDGLPPRRASAVLKGVVKSYAEYILTSRLGFTFSLYPALLISKMLGGGDFLVEGLQAPVPREIELFSPIQAAAGIQQLKQLSQNLAVLQKQWKQIQENLEAAGMAVAVSDGGEPNGYMTAGISDDANRIAAAFFRRGIDVKMRYMPDCSAMDFGIGGSRCATFSDRLFHLPNRTGLSGSAFSRYIHTIDNVLKDFTSDGRSKK